METKEIKTTVTLKGKAFNLYETKRGQYDFENAGYTALDYQKGKVSAMQAFVYYSARACAKIEKENFPYSRFIDMIDDLEVDAMELLRAFMRVTGQDKALAAIDKGEEQEAKNQIAPKPAGQD